MQTHTVSHSIKSEAIFLLLRSRFCRFWLCHESLVGLCFSSLFQCCSHLRNSLKRKQCRDLNTVWCSTTILLWQNNRSSKYLKSYLDLLQELFVLNSKTGFSKLQNCSVSIPHLFVCIYICNSETTAQFSPPRR